MVRVWFSLARGVVLESIRRKELYVIAILGFLIIAAAGALGFFGIQGLEIFAKDLSASVLGGFSTMIAIVTASRLVPDEIRNRTLYPLLSRPISRFDFLAGKLLGAILVSWLGFGILAALTSVALAMFQVQFEPVMLQYLVAKAMGLALLCSVSVALSCFMTPPAATTMSFVLAFGSGLITRAFTMAYETADAGTQTIFRLVNAMLPQYGLYDFGSRASNIGWGPVQGWVLWALLGYLVAYGGGMMTLSWLKFRRQAL